MQEKTKKSKILIILFVGILLGITIEATGEIIIYLDDLYDVNTTGVVNGNVLKYNGSAWVPSTDLTGGGTGNIFDQDLNTTNNVTFNNITLSLYPFLDKNYTDDFNGTWFSLTGKPIKAHPHNQDLNTTNAVTFSTVDTGQGANELYDMNQNVQTSDSPTFNNLYLTNLEKARAYLSGSQTYSVWSTWQPINYSAENYDIGSDFNTASYRYEVPYTGYYLITYSVKSGSVNDRVCMITSIFISTGGGAYTQSGGTVTSYMSNGLPQQLQNNGADILYLQSGDYLKIYAYIFGGSGSYTITSGTAQTYLSICRIP